MITYPDMPTDDWNEPKPYTPPKCECGSDHDFIPIHSDWCPMYTINQLKK